MTQQNDDAEPKEIEQTETGLPICPDCGEAMRIMLPRCARCGSDAFILTYNTHEAVLYCDCADCGLKVVKFEAYPFWDEEEETLEDMEPEGEC